MSAFKFDPKEREKVIKAANEWNYGTHPMDWLIDRIETLISERESWISVEVIQDELGHWYIIPKSMRSELDAHEQAISSCAEYSDEWYDAIEAFSQKFAHYMTGGDINRTQLYIQSPPKDNKK